MDLIFYLVFVLQEFEIGYTVFLTEKFLDMLKVYLSMPQEPSPPCKKQNKGAWHNQINLGITELNSIWPLSLPHKFLALLRRYYTWWICRKDIAHSIWDLMSEPFFHEPSIEVSKDTSALQNSLSSLITIVTWSSIACNWAVTLIDYIKAFFFIKSFCFILNWNLLKCMIFHLIID